MGLECMLLSLSKIAKGENLTGLLGKTDTDAIDFFIAFSCEFCGIILGDYLRCGLLCGSITFIKNHGLFKFQETAVFVYKIIHNEVGTPHLILTLSVP